MIHSFHLTPLPGEDRNSSFFDVTVRLQAAVCIVVSAMTFVTRDSISRAVSSVVRRSTEFAFNYFLATLFHLRFYWWWYFLFCLSTTLSCWRVENFRLFLWRRSENVSFRFAGCVFSRDVLSAVKLPATAFSLISESVMFSGLVWPSFPVYSEWPLIALCCLFHGVH